MRLYYSAKTNIVGANIHEIIFAQRDSKIDPAFDHISIAGESCEVAVDKDDIITGRWKGEIDAMIEDDMAVNIETVSDIVVALNTMVVENLLITHTSKNEGYIQLTDLRIEGDDGEVYTFPKNRIDKIHKYDSIC